MPHNVSFNFTVIKSWVHSTEPTKQQDDVIKKRDTCRTSKTEKQENKFQGDFLMFRHKFERLF